MQESSSLLQDFIAELMEREGAVVEKVEPRGLEFMAPAALRQKLSIPEFGRLGFSGELPEGAQRVSFESDWLERLKRALGDRGQAARRVIDLAVPSLSSPERILEHGLTLHNAVCRLSKVAPAWTRYLFLAFRYTALSDEKRDAIIWLAYNLSNASALDEAVETMLSLAAESRPGQTQTIPAGLRLPPLWDAGQLSKVVQRGLPARIRRNLTPFLNGMQKRLDRDLTRLYDYYNGLRQESLARIRKQTAETARERLRLEAISVEYPVKVADLQQKYAMRIDVEWVQTLEIIMPVQRFEITIRRRKGERRFHLDWNPASRKLEPPPCEYSYSSEGGRVVCDEALHLVSPDAHAPCARCEKDYCRACYPVKCPKCKRR